jgi:hypothetical protein
MATPARLMGLSTHSQELKPGCACDIHCLFLVVSTARILGGEVRSVIRSLGSGYDGEMGVDGAPRINYISWYVLNQ